MVGKYITIRGYFGLSVNYICESLNVIQGVLFSMFSVSVTIV